MHRDRETLRRLEEPVDQGNLRQLEMPIDEGNSTYRQCFYTWLNKVEILQRVALQFDADCRRLCEHLAE